MLATAIASIIVWTRAIASPAGLVWLARGAVLVVIVGIVIAASVLTWRYRDALADAEAARAAAAAAELRVQRLEATQAELERQRREAVDARRAADRRLAAQADETKRLLGEVRDARRRAAREPQPIGPEEAAECRAIVETYRRLLSPP